MQFLIHFTNTHAEFRLPELTSLAKLANISITIGEYSLDSPFLIITTDASVDQVIKCVARAILIKEVVLLIAVSCHLSGLLDQLKSRNLQDYKSEASFKFSITSFGASISHSDQISMIENFKFLPLEGQIDLKNPQIIYSLVLDYGLDAVLQKIYFGKWICNAGRDLIHKYDLKKRNYLGITSMDAELSLVMANQAAITTDSLVFDPFVGTGGFLVSGAHFGGYTMGSDSNLLD